MNVIDYRKIKNYPKPEVYALINEPIWVKPGHTAVVILLIEIRSLRITVKNRQGGTYDMV
jgi:hypothetical protein